MAISVHLLKNRMNTGFAANQKRKILLFYYQYTICGILKNIKADNNTINIITQRKTT